MSLADKTKGIAASLLLLGGVAFSAPKPFVLESIGGNKVEFTAVAPNGSSFQFEYDEKTNNLDMVKEWLSEVQLPSTYEGEKINPDQKKFFTEMTGKFLQYESDKILNVLGRNPKALQFYTPFGTEANNGRAVLYWQDIEYKVTEEDNGNYSFYIGIPSHRWGIPSVDYVNLKKISSVSPFYPEIKSLVDKLTVKDTASASKDYAELRELLPNLDY